MQFETKLVNGKPSIYFKEEPSTKANAVKKFNTKDQKVKKEFKKSMEISGEVDQVKVSSRHQLNLNLPNKNLNNLQGLNNNMNRNGINITQEQLETILSQINSGQLQLNNNKKQVKSYENNDHDIDDIKLFRKPQIVVNNDESDLVKNNTAYTNRPNGNNLQAMNNKSFSLVDKKKLKWQQDMDLNEKLGQQELYDHQKFNSGFTTKANEISDILYSSNNKNTSINSTPKDILNFEEQPAPLHKSKMTLAEKKKLQWQLEKEEQIRSDLNKKQHVSYIDFNFYNENRNNDNKLVATNRLPSIHFNNSIYKNNNRETIDSIISILNNNNKKSPSPRMAPPPKSLTYQPTSILKKSNREDFDRFLSHNDLINNYNNPNNNHDFINSTSSLRKSNSFNNLAPAELNEGDGNSKKTLSSNDINNMQQRQSLMDKKKEKWNQDKQSNKEDHWPYGKPGVGVGPNKTISSDKITSLPPQPPENVRNPKTKNYREALEEYQKINDTLIAITEAENKIKREQLKELQNISTSQRQEDKNIPHLDQSKLPAAMRTSILFGDVRFDDEIKKTREIEKKKWLQELEEQKREKLFESQRSLNVNLNNYKQSDSINPYDLSPREFKHLKVTNLANQRNNLLNNYNSESSAIKENIDEEKGFGRTRNLLDPAQIDEIERKKKVALQHKKEIDEQIAEKRRIQQLEEEIQLLNNIKIENEAKKLANTNQLNQELKKQQPQYQNLEHVLNLNSNTGVNSSRKPDTIATILQGDSTRIEDHDNSSSSRNTETRAQEIYRKMQEAELAAAEEKHKKLLKRLQKGGHDTKQLEKKFAELKARLSGNPNVVITNNNHFNINNGFDSVRQNDIHSSMSQVSDHEQNLEKKKQLLEKKIRDKLPPPSFTNDNENSLNNKENYELNNEQKSKIKQIFQLLREDTNGLPAELTEEHLKILLKTVQKSTSQPNADSNSNNNNKNKKINIKNNRANSNEIKKKETINQQTPPKMPDGRKPIWNYKNLQGKKAMPNSMKDPHYSERAKVIEDRRKKHLEHYQALVEKNSQKYNDFVEDQMLTNNDYDDNEDFISNNKNRNNSMSSVSTTSNNDRFQNEPKVNNKGQESIMNLLTKNLAKNTIYEEDEDLYNSRQKIKSNRILSNLDDNENANYGFVPFMRTNEFLDPAHAASPVPPSRESSAVKREREKARQAYLKSIQPADYGINLYESSNRRNKDPLLNNGLVKNNPTPRQEQILSQLATLKQSLIQKQKEVASSLNVDNNEFYDD